MDHQGHAHYCHRCGKCHYNACPAFWGGSPEVPDCESVMNGVKQKELYEELDAMAGILWKAELGDAFAQTIMLITGTVVSDVPSVGRTFTWNPDVQTEARAVVLRWLRDRGYQR